VKGSQVLRATIKQPLCNIFAGLLIRLNDVDGIPYGLPLGTKPPIFQLPNRAWNLRPGLASLSATPYSISRTEEDYDIMVINHHCQVVCPDLADSPSAR
jgi:hypothetical protein